MSKMRQLSTIDYGDLRKAILFHLKEANDTSNDLTNRMLHTIQANQCDAEIQRRHDNEGAK